MKITNEKEAETHLEIVALAISIAQREPAFREFVEANLGTEEALLGSILLAEIADKPIVTSEGRLSIAAFLSMCSRKTKFPRDEEYFLNSLYKHVPTVCIYIYTLSEEENFSKWRYPFKQPPFVMPILGNFSGSEGSFGVAYRGDGEVRRFSLDDDPEEEIIVIQPHPEFICITPEDYKRVLQPVLQRLLPSNSGVADRVLDLFWRELESQMREISDPRYVPKPDREPPIIFRFIRRKRRVILRFLNRHRFFRLFNDLISLIEENNGSSSGTPGSQVQICDRDSREDVEEVTQLQIIGGNKLAKKIVKQWSPWTDRWCEISFNYAFFFRNPDGQTVSASTGTRLRMIRRKPLRKGEVVTLDPYQNLSRWRYLENYHADEYYIHLVGENRREGNTMTISPSLSQKFKFKIGEVGSESGATLGVSWTRKQTDKDLEGDRIYYCDPANGIGHMYSTGLVNFWVKEKE